MTILFHKDFNNHKHHLYHHHNYYHRFKHHNIALAHIQDLSVCWSFLPFPEYNNKHNMKGKVRPVIVTHDYGHSVTVLPITSKYFSKSPSIRKWYYPLKNWRNHGLQKQSFVDVRQKFEIPKAYFLRKQTHHLSHVDCVGLLDKGIHLQKLRLLHLAKARNSILNSNYHYHNHSNYAHHNRHFYHHRWSHFTNHHEPVHHTYFKHHSRHISNSAILRHMQNNYIQR